jgi:NifU-like protein involved in Fe-S cluster formation
LFFVRLRVISWIESLPAAGDPPNHTKPTQETSAKSIERPRTTLPYSEAFKDHIANPRNAGELAGANAVAEETNPVCGDRLRLSLRLRGGRIEAARFLAYGCPPTLACGSALAEMIEGMTIEEAMKLSRKEVVNALGGLPTRKHHAASLAIETLHAAIG